MRCREPADGYGIAGGNMAATLAAGGGASLFGQASGRAALNTAVIRVVIHHGDKVADVNWGGRWGGHVMMNFGDNELYGFTGGWNTKPSGSPDKSGWIPSNDPSDWFSRIHGSDYYGSMQYVYDGKLNGLTSVFEIRTNPGQHSAINDWYASNEQPDGIWDKGPYDYALLGKRCGSSCYGELRRFDVIKNYNPLNSFFNAFTPGKVFDYLYRKGHYSNTYVQGGGLSHDPQKKWNTNSINYYNRTIRRGFKNRP